MLEREIYSMDASLANCDPDPVDKDRVYLLQSLLSLVDKKLKKSIANGKGGIVE